LSALSPQIMSFVISFTVVGIYWMSHHRTFAQIERYDNVLILLNLVFLLFVALMPFFAGLLGRYASLPLGVATYAAAVAAIGLAMSALWYHASRQHRLVRRDLDERFIRTTSLRALAAPLIFMISIPVAFLSPFAAIAIWWTSPAIAVAVLRLMARKPGRLRLHQGKGFRRQPRAPR
jgi:uncharacterized membrane protein